MSSFALDESVSRRSVDDLGSEAPEGIKLVQNKRTVGQVGEENSDESKGDEERVEGLNRENIRERAMQDMEKISKRLFYGGCFFLPFLWLVGIVYFWDIYRSNKCNQKTKRYISLSIRGFILYTAILIIWITIFQLNWTSDWAKALLLFPFDNW